MSNRTQPARSTTTARTRTERTNTAIIVVMTIDIESYQNHTLHLIEKKVRFALGTKHTTIHLIPHRSDLLDHDHDSSPPHPLSGLWWTQHEYMLIRCEIKRVTKLMERHQRRSNGKRVLLTPFQECIRGLEHLTKQGAFAKRKAYLDSVHTVLLEQDHQRSLKVANENIIRSRYREVNLVYVVAAIEQGQKDAKYYEMEENKYDAAFNNLDDSQYVRDRECSHAVGRTTVSGSPKKEPCRVRTHINRLFLTILLGRSDSRVGHKNQLDRTQCLKADSLTTTKKKDG